MSTAKMLSSESEHYSLHHAHPETRGINLEEAAQKCENSEGDLETMADGYVTGKLFASELKFYAQAENPDDPLLGEMTELPSHRDDNYSVQHIPPGESENAAEMRKEARYLFTTYVDALLGSDVSFDNEELRRHHAVYKLQDWTRNSSKYNPWLMPGPPTEPYPPGFGES